MLCGIFCLQSHELYKLQLLSFISLLTTHIIIYFYFSEQPASALLKVQDFIGAEHHLTDDNFLLQEDTGLYCIRRRSGLG